MMGEDMQQFDITIADPYAAQVQSGFYTALLVAGLPVNVADSVAARASAGDLRWRFANTDANLGSTVLPINGVGAEDAYGIGVAFPPMGANGNLAVSLQWTPGQPTTQRTLSCSTSPQRSWPKIGCFFGYIGLSAAPVTTT
jgi:hypothetical protein